MNTEKNILEIPIEDILPNRFQPRLSFNEEGINELAESIKQHGIIQPLVVRKLGDKYEIIAGERRYKAATMAGLAKVPVIISDIDDNKSAEVALVENIQRRNLTAIEEAKSYKNLLDRGYLTQEQLANKMGVSQSSIANKLRLLNLDEEVQDALLNEKISERHARALLSLDKEDQKKWLKRIIDERLTVRQLDMELKKSENSEDSGEEEIKLVNINPDINEIVTNAEDIVVERAPHDVASMLVPENGVETIKKEPVSETPVKNPNKFFNFLEDEQANMNVMEQDDINVFTSTPTLEMVEPVKEEKVEEPILNENNEALNINPEEPKPENEGIETLDDFNTLNEDKTIEEQQIQPIPEISDANLDDLQQAVDEIVQDQDDGNQFSNLTTNETPVMPVDNTIIEEATPSLPDPVIPEEPTKIEEQPDATEEIKPFKNIFFTDEDEEIETPKMEEPINNNTIQEMEPIVEEPYVDPLDSIVTLEPGYEQKQEELAGRDLKTAINVIRDTVSNLENRGFVIECEEADLEDIYHITIKINKDNKKDSN